MVSFFCLIPPCIVFIIKRLGFSYVKARVYEFILSSQNHFAPRHSKLLTHCTHTENVQKTWTSIYPGMQATLQFKPE